MDHQNNTSNNTDLSQLFSSVTGWTFSYPDHHTGLIQTKVDTLCNKVANVLNQADPENAPTQDDARSLGAAMTFLFKHKEKFTIADLMACFDIKSRAYNELSQMIFASGAAQILANDEFEKMKIEFALLKAQMKKQLESQQTNNFDNQTSKPKSAIKTSIPDFNPRTRSDSCSSVSTTIPSTFNFNSSSSPPASAPPLVTGSSAAGSKTKNELELEARIEKLTKQVEFQSRHVFTERVKVDTDPPIFKSGSIRAFGRKEYSRWARKCGLTASEATLFLCMSFTNEIESSHVDKLAMDSFGRPRYESIIPLIEQIICDLKFSEESQTKIRNRFDEFYAKPPPVSLDAEFLRCCELRERGWPQEGSIDHIKFVKHKFGNRLYLNHQLHMLIFGHINTPDWINALSFFELTAQLRNIQTMFFRKQSHTSNGNSSNPNKPTNATVHMDINNIQQPDISGEFTQEVHTSQVPAQVLPTAVNNIPSKKCRNEKCNKPFTPSDPKFYCCSKECVAIWKEKRYGPKKSAKPFNNLQTFNNLQAAMSATTNNASDNSAVSLKEFYITPVHIYLPGSDIPIVINNSLFDTGAGVTIMTLKMLEKLNLKKLLVIDPGPVILGGDQSEMKGRIGHVDIEMAIEDTSGYLTENFTQRFLVYKNLNNDIIVGQGSMKNGIRSFLGIPELKTMLFNPSSRTFKYQMKLLADHNRKVGKEVTDKPESKIKSGTKVNKIEEESKSFFKYSAPEFSDSEQFILNIPLSRVNETAMKMFSEKVSELTTGFINNMEAFGQSELIGNKVFGTSSMNDILTSGGLDGTFEETQISVSDTKTIETKKGTIQVGGQLSDEMCQKFKKFVDNFKGKVFDSSTLGRTKHECQPELKPGETSKSATPKYMPLNPFMQSEAAALVQKMVDLGVLEETKEPANSSIFIVQKSSGKWRLICDLRRYNEKIVDYVVHLPSPFELINKICTFKMLSYFDFSDAYFQIPLTEDCLKNHPIIASVSGQQYNYKYLRMAQGLKIATSWFIGILNEIYAKISKWVVNYLDDSVLGSENDELVHYNRVVEFIEITEEAGLRLSLPKCIFFALNLSFLNYTLSEGAWSMSQNQRATINALNCDNLTKSKRESLAAFINHFNRFDTGVSHAARKIRSPETSVENVKSILDNIKKKLVNSPALSSVNFVDPLYIFTDASKFDCAGVIFQKSKGGMKLVTCFSKKFPESVVCKPVHERELWSMQQLSISYKYLLIGNHKKVFLNDSKIVLASEKSKAPSLRCLFDTMKSTFSNVEFRYVETSKNASDIFTRVSNNVTCAQNSVDGWTSNNIATDKPSRNSTAHQMSENLRNKILKIHVNAGCASAQKILLTFQGLGQELKAKDVTDIISKCTLCNSLENFSRPRRSAPGITIAKEETCGCTVFIDHKTIITKDRVDTIRDNEVSDGEYQPEYESNNQSCLTVFEPVSGHVWFHPVSDYKSETVKEALRTFFMINGPSKNVVADNAHSFTSLKGWLKKEFDCSLHHTSVYHPASNLSERAHRSFEKVLRTYDSAEKGFKFENWEDALTKACISLNSLRHAQFKISPYEVFKNRTQSEVEPPRFYPVGAERRIMAEKFMEKVDKIVQSKLKIVLPVFKKGTRIKVNIPNELSRMGVVTSLKDHCYKNAVQVKFGKQKPVSVNKDFICINVNGDASVDQQSSTKKRKFSDIESPNATFSQQTENSSEIAESSAMDDEIVTTVTTVSTITVTTEEFGPNQAAASPEITELESWD